MVRLLSGALLAAAFVALIWFASTPVLLSVALVVAALAFQEYARVVRAIGAIVRPWPTIVPTLAAVAMVPFPWIAIESVLGAALIIAAVSVLTSNRQGASGFHDVSAAVLAPVYLGLPLGSLVAIHAMGGRHAVLLLVFTIVVSDSAQYYTGRLFGRRLLAPRISPKKTREGALGGFVIGPAFLVLAGHYWLPGAAPLSLAGMGVLLVAAGIFGDLFESLLKRSAGVKDSSTLIPGHGGILDRIDALLFATPIFYFYLRAL